MLPSQTCKQMFSVRDFETPHQLEPSTPWPARFLQSSRSRAPEIFANMKFKDPTELQKLKVLQGLCFFPRENGLIQCLCCIENKNIYTSVMVLMCNIPTNILKLKCIHQIRTQCLRNSRLCTRQTLHVCKCILINDTLQATTDSWLKC